MPRRVWVSTAILAVGSLFLATVQLAGAAPRKGGVFLVGTTGASVQIDPQLAYDPQLAPDTTASWLEYATAAKLYNYKPNGAFVPEVAARFKVSGGGLRYTFFLRRGFRFSNGTPVTADSFAYAFERVRSRDLASPARYFVKKVRDVEAHGMRFVVRLREADPQLLSTLAMPFFQATSKKLPLDHEVVTVRSMADLPSAGPYTFALNDGGVTKIRRNPFWSRGPGRSAPRNLAGVDIYWNLNEQMAFDMVERNELDEGPIPSSQVQRVAEQYGVNRARYWVRSGLCLNFVAFNNSRGLFHRNATLRRAVSWALDRTDYAGVSFHQTPWTHLLPPDAPGSITKPRLQPYGTRADVAKARALAAGHFRDGRITVYYQSSGTIGPAKAEVVRRDLVNLGFDPANITMRGFPGFGIYDAFATGGGDLAVSLGFCQQSFADPPGAFFGGPYFPDNHKYSGRIARAMRLTGVARDRAFGRLDLDIMRDVAPFAVMGYSDNRFFFSDRVDPRSLRYHRVYADWSIPDLALK